MQVLVMAATEMEIQPFIESKPEVDILISGVGAPSTMYRLFKKITSQRYDLVIQAGIAGKFRQGAIGISECALINCDVFADLGVQENKQFYSLSDLNFTDANESPYSNGQLFNNNSFFMSSSLPQVGAITVNTVSDDIFQANLYAAKYNAHVESMEGAALHYVCLLESIPFLQLRGISN
jgi:futalosine hydrolase